MKVSYLGPKGTFSEIAVTRYFSKNISKLPKSSIEDDSSQSKNQR
jgi:prephenate dehydratase